jgi:hypothetical protein
MGALGTADAAKPDGKGKGHPNGGGMQNSHNGHAERGDDHHGRRFGRFPGRGIYLYTGERGSGGCGYAYRKWQVTGNRYWRARYYDCRNG